MLDCIDYELMENSVSKLSDNELQQIIATAQREQNARKSKKRQELVNKVITALHDLQTECRGGCITIVCNECECEMLLSFDEIAEKIKDEIECW
jgi:hypothetical protein